MPIVQTITYHGGRDYFAGYIRNIIDKTDINACVDFKKGVIILVINDTDMQAVEAFSQSIDQLLPYSVFLGSVETRQINEDINYPHFQASPCKLSLCPACIKELFDIQSPYYLDQNFFCSHYFNSESSQNDIEIFKEKYDFVFIQYTKA